MYQSNYQIIVDESVLNDFISWLPDLKDHERYYCALFGRKKYAEEAGLKSIKSDNQQLGRFIARKNKIVEKIRHLEIAQGRYLQKGVVMPQEALAMYITPNPRDLRKASYKSISAISEMLLNQNNFNVHNEVLSQIHQSKSYTAYVHFDIDNKDFDVHVLQRYVNVEALKVMQTRGGYHILVDPNKVSTKYQQTFYKNIMSIEGIDVVSKRRKSEYSEDDEADFMLPIAGTYQGGFMPKFVI